MLAAVQDPAKLCLWQPVHFRQHLSVHEHVDQHGTSGGGLERPKALDSVVADQVQQLESLVENHFLYIIARKAARCSPSLPLGCGLIDASYIVKIVRVERLLKYRGFVV